MVLITRCRNFRENAIKSSIPTEIGKLTRLIELYDRERMWIVRSRLNTVTLRVIAENNIDSTIPSEIGLLTLLTSMYAFASAF
jgi:hypothetical protein